MKHLEIFCLILAVTLCQTTSATDKTPSSAGKPSGVRVQEKAVAARHMRGLMQGITSATPTLLLRVETRLENGKQMIVATATAHAGGQGGPLVATETLDVRVSEPAQFSREGKGTNTTVATGSASAPEGKFKTVVADASMKILGSEMTRVTVRVPGDGR